MDVETKPTGEVRPIRLDKAVSKRADCFFCCKKKEVKGVDLGKEGKKEWLSWLAIYG
jgi:hypothetical protein